MNSCYAKWVNQLHDFCVNRSCTCCGNVLETSRIASRLCVCVRVCVCVLGWLSQLVPQQQCEWLKTTPRCVYKLVRRPCNILLMAEVNAASNNNWTCEASWRQEAESAKQKSGSTRSASTAKSSHKDFLRHCPEDWRSSCSPSSNRRPVKSRVLTTQRARKAQYDFGGKFHPHLQRIGNTDKARLLLEVDIDQWRCYGQFHFLFNRLTAQKNPTMQWGEHLQWTSRYFLHHRQLWWGCCLITLAMSTNHELTPHVADKEALLINCHCTLN